MMIDYTPPRDLSFGMTPDYLKFDPVSLESAHSLEWPEHFLTLVGSDYQRHDPDAPNRTLNMALALYERVTNNPDNALDGLGRVEIFAACLDTAIIWEVG